VPSGLKARFVPCMTCPSEKCPRARAFMLTTVWCRRPGCGIDVSATGVSRRVSLGGRARGQVGLPRAIGEGQGSAVWSEATVPLVGTVCCDQIPPGLASTASSSRLEVTDVEAIAVGRAVGSEGVGWDNSKCWFAVSLTRPNGRPGLIAGWNDGLFRSWPRPVALRAWLPGLECC